MSLYLCTALLSTSEETPLSHAVIGAYAVDAKSGKVLLDEKSHVSLIPASCMKVVCTAAALHLLDSKSHFRTDLEYDGAIDPSGVLHGHLFIHGGGDPCLGSDRVAPALSWEKQLDDWVAAVKKAGIQAIEGEVFGDASQWETALAAPSWTWEDLGNYYGAGACALSFHENAYSLIFAPGNKVGEPASILRTEPPLPQLSLHNEVKTGPEGSGDCACIYGCEFSMQQYARGTIPAGVSEFTLKGALPDPCALCADLFRQALQKQGVTVLHQPLPRQTQRTVFYSTFSPSVGDIVHWINRESINLYAEHLLKKMGEVIDKEGSTQAGIRAVTTFLRDQNVDLSGFNMADGSGLSRKNLVTAKQLVAVLLKMRDSPLFSLFLDSLPERGQGIRAKSGTMSQVNALSGYVGDIAFAILINHSLDPAKSKEAIQSRLDHLLSEEAP